MTFPRKHVNTRVVFILSVLLLTTCTTQLPTDPQHIGIVTTYTGMPSVIRNGKTYWLSTQSRIYSGDVVKTDETSRLKINMIDDSQIILGQESHLVFHIYDYEPGSFFPMARMTFISGNFRARTENVTRAWFGEFEIQTPLALVRPKNADFWGELSPSDNTLGIALLEGTEVRIANDHGSARIKRQNYGSSVHAGSAPQRPKRWSERKVESIRESTAPRGAFR